MSEPIYCWRVKKVVPLLNETEWQIIHPHLIESIQEIQRHRQNHGATIEEAKASGFGQAALDCYFKLTGYRETNPDNLWRYRRADYGVLCASCSKPLRTPSAQVCAECGSPASAVKNES